MPHKIIVEDSIQGLPRDHELIAAEVMAEYFGSDVIFLRRLESKTPDLYILKTNVRWEIKSPEGNGKYTIQNNLRLAEQQSRNIILDLHRCKLSESQALARVREYINDKHCRIKKLKIVTKKNKIVDILDKK